MKNQIFTLIALLMFAASMLSCAAERPEKPAQPGSVAPVAVTETETKSAKKTANMDKKPANTNAKNVSPTPPVTAPTLKEETTEPDPETMSEACLALREYAEKMLELHPFYNEANIEAALKQIFAEIPHDLDYMRSAEAKSDILITNGFYPCPYCFAGQVNIEIHHNEADGVRVGEMTYYGAAESRWYPDKGDKAFATCPNCKKSFDIMDYCNSCQTVGNVKTVCLGDTDQYTNWGYQDNALTQQLDSKCARVHGWCQNCDASFVYQHCYHTCGDSCPYERHTRDELKERYKAFIQKQHELRIARAIFSANYFANGIF